MGSYPKLSDISSSKIFVGMKVLSLQSESNGYAEVIGKVTKSQQIRVAYYISPVEKVEKRLSLSQLSYQPLPAQTRCFFQTNGVTYYGRILLVSTEKGIPRTYSIKLGGIPRAVPMREDEFSVRAYVRPPDPVEILANLAQETPFFFAGRYNLKKELIRQEKLSCDMPGIASSKVMLFGHQIEIARRVLGDHRIRYLLADEVGLGKTIEAGMILRQVLIDKPDTSIAVFAPKTLVSQWKFELDSRFSLPTISVVPHSQLNHSKHYFLDMVVIDEVHRLATVCNNSEISPLYLSASKLTRNVKNVLLITATPALRSTDELLRLMHLLEPDIYHLEDRDDFHRLFKKRKKIGAILQAISTAKMEALFRRHCNQLCQLLPDDSRVAEIVADASEDRTLDVEATKNRLISLVSETYRIHRRMLRTKRSWLIPYDKRLSRSIRLIVEPDLNEEITSKLWAYLEDWRNSIWRDLDKENMSRVSFYRELYFSLANGIASNSSDLLNNLDAAINDNTSNSEEAKEVLFKMTELAQRRLRAEPRMEIALALLAKANDNEKYVVFCSDPQNCQKLKLQFNNNAYGATAEILSIDLNQSELESALQRFLESSNCRILICDQTGEEGINLQASTRMIMYDLPVQPMRIEQRIGRLDRIGRIGEIPCHICISTEEDELSVDAKWSELLIEGLDIFNESVSDIPFLLEEIVAEFKDRVFRLGPLAVDDYISEASKSITSRRVENEQQDIIDGLHLPGVHLDNVVKAFSEADAVSTDYLDALRNYVEGHLGLKYSPCRDGSAFVFTRLPNRDVLIPVEHLVEPAAVLTAPSTVYRDVVCNHLSLDFMRPGHPAISICKKMLEWDDRGRAYALWRLFPKNEEPLIVVRAILKVSPDYNLAEQLQIDSKKHALSVHGIERRIAGWFPSQLIDVCIMPDGSIASEAVSAICCQPYDKCMDRNLGSKRVTTLIEKFGSETWEKIVRRAAQVAISFAASHSSISTLREFALNAAKCFFDDVSERLNAQRASGIMSNVEVDRERDNLQQVRTAIMSSISNLHVELDSLGAYVLSAEEFWKSEK